VPIQSADSCKLSKGKPCPGKVNWKKSGLASGNARAKVFAVAIAQWSAFKSAVLGRDGSVFGLSQPIYILFFKVKSIMFMSWVYRLIIKSFPELVIQCF